MARKYIATPIITIMSVAKIILMSMFGKSIFYQYVHIRIILSKNILGYFQLNRLSICT